MGEFELADFSRAGTGVGSALVSEDSFSTRPSGIAAQFRATKGCSRAG